MSLGITQMPFEKVQQVHLKIGTGPAGKAAFDRHTLWAPDLVYTFFMT